MSKMLFSFFFSIVNNCENKFLFSIIIIFSKMYIVLSTTDVNSPFPITLQLNDKNNLFIANEKGMYFCDINFDNVTSHEYYNKSIDNFEDIKNKILVAQFEPKDGGNIICVIENVFYLFQTDKNLMIMGNLPNKISDSDYLSLLAYKKDDDDYYHFIISFLYNYLNIIICHYKANSNEYNIVSNFTYKPFYLDYTAIQIRSNVFTCQIMKSEKRGNVLTCCYNSFNNDLIVVQSFDINNNITEIEEYYSKIPIDNLKMISSTISNDKKNMLVCYSLKNDYGYCFNYNFDNNIIYNNKPLVEKCDPQYTTFKVNYFPQSEEYIFICKNQFKFTLIKFDINFHKINPDEISIDNYEIPDYYNFNSLSLIYIEDTLKYYIIIDSKYVTNSTLVTRRFEINTNFTNHFASELDIPQEFIEKTAPIESFIDETNKYFVYTETFMTIANSEDNKKVIFDFMDENNLIVKTKDNKTINSSLYYFQIEKSNINLGNFTLDIEGEEKEVINGMRITNITKLNYYPKFSENSYIFSFTYNIYLKNVTLASKAATISIYICRENCSCDFDNSYCLNCLENYGKYNYDSNCKSINDLKNKLYLEDTEIYVDCYKSCKTCSQVGYEENMFCLSCYTEYGDYLLNNNCKAKNCTNLFYRDKNTGMKTCINESICPEDYPFLNNSTKECKEYEEVESKTEESKTEENQTEDIKTEESKTEENQKEESNTEESKTEDGKTEETEENKTEESNTEESKTEDSKTEENDTEKTEEAPKSSANTIENVKTDETTSKATDNNYNYQSIIDFINEFIEKEKIEEINKTYSVLSNSIKNINISFLKEDFTLSGDNVTYQITTTGNQKNANYKLNVSVIDLGECEKKIKRNISYEEDPNPLIILKIDVKKTETKSTAVEYEVYNPYTRDKIDLSICTNTTIAIYSPINLNNQEISLYDELDEQGYNLFDVNNSFYIDPCTQYTSSNGTDVSLLDRKDYYYNQDIVLCEDICKYIEVNTETKKVYCLCSVKNSVNLESNQEFSPKILLEQFYKVNTYANFEVLSCYHLVFSLKGLKNNICFYIILVLLFFFLISMIINLFSALKKIDQLIFKIFQDRFMFFFMQKIIMEGRERRNAKVNNEIIINNKKEENSVKPKLNWFQKLKMSKLKKENESNSNIENSVHNINNKSSFNAINEKKSKHKIRSKSNNELNIYDVKNINYNSNKNEEILKLKNNKKKEKKEKNEINNIDNDNENDNYEISQRRNAINLGILKNKGNHQTKNGININIIKNLVVNHNPPKKKKEILKEVNMEEILRIKEKSPKIVKKRKSKKKKKKIENDSSNSIANLRKFGHNKRTLYSFNESNVNKKTKHKNKIKIKDKENMQKTSFKDNKKIDYIDEELNRMNYENALLNDKRNYLQYYWSLLKKKHLIILTFISNDDYNVFLIKFCLFILSLALFFSINTLFYRDSTFHQIFTENGKYNLIYQIPQVLYSSLISFIMTLILKTLSLSQNELIAIKKELDYPKSKKLAEKTKKCLKIKFCGFFILGLLLLLFFWYYLTSFAAVYINTQIHLIKDTLLSFGLSMSYPLLYNFIPGIFRFIALKSSKKNKECIYRTGQLLSLF